jgi:multidrug resistance efflux pump
MSASPPAGPFRERALQQGDVREALDEHVRIVGVPRWIALAIGVLVVVGFIAWSASKEVQNTIDGEGVLGSQAGVVVVAAPVSGTVLQAPPAGGTAVRAGAVIARIDSGQGRAVVVRARTAGTVQSTAAAVGSVVSAGEQLAALAPAGQAVAYLFLPLGEAGQVKPGMKVLLSSTVEESHASGLLQGRVRRVDTSPASPAELGLLLGPALAATFPQDQPVVKVDIALVRNPSAPGGYARTAGSGSPGAPASGSLLTGRVVLQQRSPLDYVF